MSDEVNSFVDELRAEIQGIESYHNHKEMMAWTATALFLAGGAAFVSTVPRVAIEHQMAATMTIVVGAIAIAFFVYMQFERRWVASDTSDGLRATLTKLCDPSTNRAALDWTVSTDDPVPGLPKFVAQEIASVAKQKRRFRPGAHRDRRWWSEAASYTIMLLTCLNMLLVIWNPPAAEEKKIDAMAARLSELTAALPAMSTEFRTHLTEIEARLQARMLEIQKSHSLALQGTRDKAVRP